MKRFLVTLAE